MHCIFLACTKQQKKGKRSRGLEGNIPCNVLHWEGGDRGLTIQKMRVNGWLLRAKAERLFMATEMPGENIIAPKIIYLPSLYSLPGVSKASLISNSHFPTNNHAHSCL